MFSYFVKLLTSKTTELQDNSNSDLVLGFKKKKV